MNQRLTRGFFQELAKLKRSIQYQLNAVRRSCQENISMFSEKQIRLARTIPGSAAYPASPANTYQVELGSGVFTETAGTQTLTFTPYSPQIVRFAHQLCGVYLPENSIVIVNLIAKQYYITGYVGKVITDLRVTADNVQYKSVSGCAQSDWVNLSSVECNDITP